MIIRVVKMTFREEEVDSFLGIFKGAGPRIRNFQGCQSVELLRSPNKPSMFFTLSKWEAETDLEAYRNSELFKSTWKATKALFAESAAAWSLENTGL